MFIFGVVVLTASFSLACASLTAVFPLGPFEEGDLAPGRPANISSMAICQSGLRFNYCLCPLIRISNLTSVSKYDLVKAYFLTLTQFGIGTD